MGVMLVVLPIGDEVARLPQEWFLNTPVLWLGALVLVSTIRGPLRNASMLIKKLLSLAAASLVALGLLVLLVWEPVIKASKAPPVFTALWILLLGLAPIGLIVSFFRILFSKANQQRTLSNLFLCLFHAAEIAEPFRWYIANDFDRF